MRLVARLLLSLFLLSAPAWAQDSSEELVRVVELASDVLTVAERPVSELDACIGADGMQFADAGALEAYRLRRTQQLRREVTRDEARRLFDLMARQPHIPFRYPEDGCYARAHEMARLLEMNGYYSRKVFLFGDLRVRTANSPEGFVEWRYHVAPVIPVRMPGGALVDHVIDPSIATGPITVEAWRALQTGASCPEVPVTASMASLPCFRQVTERFTYEDSSSFTEDHWLESDRAASDQILRAYMRIQRERFPR